MEAGDRIIVGVNAYPEGNDAHQVEILHLRPEALVVRVVERLDEVLDVRRHVGEQDAAREAAEGGLQDPERLAAFVAKAEAGLGGEAPSTPPAPRPFTSKM